MKRETNHKDVPIRRSKCGVTTRPRIPSDEPYVPGLRKQPTTNAIGFLAHLSKDMDEE